jgi:hypothetical protein
LEIEPKVGFYTPQIKQAVLEGIVKIGEKTKEIFGREFF